MPKPKTIFSCQQCGYQSAKWLGRCPDCDNWNTLVEEAQVAQEQQPSRYQHTSQEAPQPLADVISSGEARQSTEIKELDRVLGGGIVSGSVVLV